MSLRALLFALALGSLIGCVPFTGTRYCLPDGGDVADAGLDAGFGSCIPAPGEAPLGDGGPTSDADTGASPSEDSDRFACRALVEDVCGTGEPPACADDSACVAARLLEEHEPEECSAALANDVTYPSCRPGPCALLVDRVCGGATDDAACRDAPGCEPARVMHERSTSPEAEEREEAEASCNAALEDDVVFAPCQ